jgi:hypothetical protein
LEILQIPANEDENNIGSTQARGRVSIGSGSTQHRRPDIPVRKRPSVAITAAMTAHFPAPLRFCKDAAACSASLENNRRHDAGRGPNQTAPQKSDGGSLVISISPLTAAATVEGAAKQPGDRSCRLMGRNASGNHLAFRERQGQPGAAPLGRTNPTIRSTEK